MDNRSEKLLRSWIYLYTNINNERIVSDMSFNEMLVCHCIRNQQLEDSSKRVTATDLCNITGMLKSQMNRTLNMLEEKDIVIKERSKIDKRQVFVSLRNKQTSLYTKEHKRIIGLVDKIVQEVGEETIDNFIQLVEKIVSVSDKIIYSGKE